MKEPPKLSSSVSSARADSNGEIASIVLSCLDDSVRWFPQTSRSLPFTVLALCGETGELANLVKKAERGSRSYQDAAFKREVAMEATDVFIYLMEIFGLLGVDPAKAYEMKRIVNEKRFGHGR